jgi:adenine phosphoribosyltransferase/phosphomevalonate kinase
MATLNSLELALRQEPIATDSFIRQSLTDAEYSISLEILIRESGWKTYREFIIPHLTHLLAPFLKSDASISVLEVGPGPKSVLGYLPRVLRKKIRKYTAFEPNEIFAARLQEWLRLTSEIESPLPGLELPPSIHRARFSVDSKTLGNTGDEKYDLILFCHSMYGMNPKVKVIERCIDMLVEQPKHGIVIVFHRDGSLQLDGLACHRTASFPTGAVCVADDDEELDRFTVFLAGFTLPDVNKYRALRIAWQKLCRAMGRRDKAFPNQLVFSAPDIMMAFTKDATAVPELTAQVPILKEDRLLKNREALSHRPAAIVKPTEIQHIQQCVQWAVKHRVGLTITGGGHSGHCQWPNIVSVDMGAFDKLHILPAKDSEEGSVSNSGVGPLIIVEAGCKTGDIIRKAMAEGLTVPLGSRPSVGAGLWLQGGIGHLSRLYGLSCDAIVGAVIVSVENGQILCIGQVPTQHHPAGAFRPENEADLLWAIKGAGTNFGIIVSVVFKAYPASTHSVRNWRIPLKDSNEAMMKINYLDNLVAKDLSDRCSVDGYLYWDKGQLHLGVTLFEDPGADLAPTTSSIDTLFGLEDCSKTVDENGLFMADMYMSGMHDGHGRGKTSSFKRCIFLKDIGNSPTVELLIKAIEARPTPLCYLHLLHGDEAVRSVAPDATAFGCRDWEFACVISGVWPRDQEGPDLAHTVVTWVYDAAMEFLPQCCGVYSADLGPDPRDTALVAKAFGPNRPRLARLKDIADPHNVLAYACPLRRLPVGQRLIVLITGESGAGKDYCADIWANVFNTCVDKSLIARVVSISDVTKKEYAAADSSVDLKRLLQDRAYKEEHRPALTAVFDDQVKRRPQLLEEHFLDVAYGAMDVDVLLITGMREESPLAAYSHLVPESRLLEVRVEASKQTRQARRGCHLDGEDDNKSTEFDSCPSLVFKNEEKGSEAAIHFAECCLLPLFDEPIQRLANMVCPVPDFPRQGITFQHVLDIAQQPDGLRLCTRLLRENLFDDWDRISAIACCEVGGYNFAAPLAEHLNIPLALIREAGKLPPPTISVTKFTSHISSSTSSDLIEKQIEMKRYLIPRGSSVVVVDDVLATGKTLFAVLQLLELAGISQKYITVLVVAEFPVHRGRALLRDLGFGAVHIRSLLVFDGV